jgi:hypothetical protein
MSYFDLDPAGAESARQQAILNPIQPGDMGPGFWSGSLKGAGQGLLQSGAQAALLVSDAATGALMPTARKIDDFFGGATVQDFLRSEQQKTTDAVFKLMPGPEIGKVGQLAYGLATVIPQAVGGTLAGGPGGGAAAVATIQGYAGKIELEHKGVDAGCIWYDSGNPYRDRRRIQCADGCCSARCNLGFTFVAWIQHYC